MHDDLIHLLSGETPSTEEDRARLVRLIADDPKAARLAENWTAVCETIDRRVDELMPDSSLMVLHGLAESGHGAALTQTERGTLVERQSAIRAAEEGITAFRMAVSDIKEQADEFDRCWAALSAVSAESETASATGSIRAHRPSRRPDRAPSGIRPIRLRRFAARFAMAASVVAFVATGLFLAQRDANRTVVVADDTTRLVELEDGTVVRLLPEARLTYAARGDDTGFDRTVHLAGSAFFDIRPGSTPFIVRTDVAHATVLGTSFGVVATLQSTEIVLATGRLSVAPTDSPQEAVILEPGQRARVIRSDPAPIVDAVDITESLSWTGLLLFRVTSMSDVAAVIERRYGVVIGVDPALVGEAVTGTFDPGRPVDEVLGVLATALGAHVEIEADGSRKLVRD